MLFAIIALLLTISFITPLSQGYGTQSFNTNLNTGPFLEEVQYKVIPNQDMRVLALQNGEIEMDTSFFDISHLTTLSKDPDISIYSTIRNGYGHININCRIYPLNISGLRRAFAFAYNKNRVTVEAMQGYSIEHDSLVPQVSDWCAENEFDWHYYDARPDIGNQILNDLGFEIDEVTGFRLAPNGDPFNITIDYAACSCLLPGLIAQIGVDALLSLHIDANKRACDFNEYYDRLKNHIDYDMVYYATVFNDFDITWLAYEYWSVYADVYGENPTNFANETYDFWRDQLLYGQTYEEISEAATEMQKILHCNVPRLVVYEDIYFQGYRNDKYTGQIEDLLKHMSGSWTMRKMHNLDGSFGGTIAIALDEEPDSFNIFVTDSPYSDAIISELWPSLYKLSPDATPWPDLVKTIVTETHSDNALIPEGHTRFTINIVENATWNDCTPLTAEDISFTFRYLLESAEHGNPAGDDLDGLVSVFTPSSFQVVLEFDSESYWTFSRFAYKYIIPEHIFNGSNKIGPENWNVWNPILNQSEPYINCGPFVLTDWEIGEHYDITRNPNFYYRAEPPTTSITTYSTTNRTIDQNPYALFLLGASIGAGSVIIIVSGTFIVIRSKKQVTM